NRAPAKVQSALLEAMQERQVSIGGTTFPLEDPFMVLATQNPIEHEGTYALPEAQLDRFMLNVRITYPTRDEEKQILDRFVVPGVEAEIAPVATRDAITAPSGALATPQPPTRSSPPPSPSPPSTWTTPSATTSSTSSTPRANPRPTACRNY